MSSSTQSRHPWRATVRTVFAFVVAVAAVWGLVVETAGVDSTVPVIAWTVSAAGAVTRVLALPQVEALLQRFFPWLAAEPPTEG